MKVYINNFLSILQKNKKLFVFSLIVIFIFFWLLLYVFTQIVSQRHVVTNFDECAEHGFPVMESDPRQCRDNLGNVYIESED
jgi:hypothetical protein